MEERDVERLADGLQRKADELGRRGDELQDRAQGVGEDWDRKRTDQSIPGAPPPEDSEDEAHERQQPEPDAQPPDAGPSEAETASEGGAGPPGDTGDESG
jgi:hypothetical protein